MAKTANLDKAAVGASLACIVHCLALPILAVSLPFLGAFAEAEWVHALTAIMTIVISLTVVLTARSSLTVSFVLTALPGLTLITLALFAEKLGLSESLLTVMGGSLIAAAHLSRLKKGSPHRDHSR